MTVLVGGLRALGVSQGIATACSPSVPGTLSNDFFVNLLAPVTGWRASDSDARLPASDGRTATAVDLVFGSNSQLRALAEVYASDDATEKFVRDFAAAWAKVMEIGQVRPRLSPLVS